MGERGRRDYEGKRKGGQGDCLKCCSGGLVDCGCAIYWWEIESRPRKQLGLLDGELENSFFTSRGENSCVMQ